MAKKEKTTRVHECVSVSNTKVYKEPDDQSEVICTIPGGKVSIIEKQNGFGLLEHIPGWIPLLVPSE